MAGGAAIDSLVLDVSTYDYSTFNASCFYDSGVRRIIIGCHPKAQAEQMIMWARAAGIEVIGLYGFVYFGRDPYYVHRDTDNAVSLALKYGIKRIWMDAELDAIGIGVDVPASNPMEREFQLLQVQRKIEANGLEPGVYTASWWWPSEMGNSTTFMHLPLWHAGYQSAPITRVNYGGWTSVAIHQYTSSGGMCGRDVRDLNYLFEEDDEMSAADKALLQKLYLAIADGDPEKLDAAASVDFTGLAGRLDALETNGDTVARKDIQELRAAFVTFSEANPDGRVPRHSHTATVDLS